MKKRVEFPAFCNGCEFAGSAGGEHSRLVRVRVYNENGVTMGVALDNVGNISKGIVPRQGTEAARHDTDFIFDTIEGCGGGPCALREVGFEPHTLAARGL